VFDDLREEDASDKYYGWYEFLGLLRYRAGALSPTIVTTQLTLATTGELLSEMLQKVSRLVLFPVEGPNRRRQENQDLFHSFFGEPK
jgi:hypothetical protein